LFKSIVQRKLVVGHWTFYLTFKGPHLGFYKNVLPPLEVMWERIGEALRMVFSADQFGKTWH
jgi:hypothetical protein